MKNFLQNNFLTPWKKSNIMAMFTNLWNPELDSLRSTFI